MTLASELRTFVAIFHEMGVYAQYDRRDTCGKLECAREEREAYAQEREEAHERLDRDMGW